MAIMKDERKDEIGKLFLLKKEISKEELKELEIQEIIFLIFSAKCFKEKQEFINDDSEDKLKIFLDVLKEKIKYAEELFIAYDQNTNYPYIDEDDRIWVFSKEEFALNAKDYFLQQLVMLEMKKISKEEVMVTFANLHRLGIKKIIMDNGEYTVEINRDDILPPPDWSETSQICIPVENPELQHAMIKFFQILHSKITYEGKDQICHQLEDRMLDEVIKAKYLLPMQLKEDIPSDPNEEGTVTLKQGDTLQFASIVGNNNEDWLPVFTDWTEFEKAYDKNIWKSNIISYDDLLSFSKNMKGAVINFKGLSLELNDKNKMMINEYKKEGNNTKPSSVKECIVPKDTKVMIGEPKEYPTKMIEVVIKYMKKHKRIKKAYLRLMIKENEKSYLVVVDFDGKKEELFKEIADVALPYLEGMYLDMVGVDDWSENVVKDIKPFYKKKFLGLI